MESTMETINKSMEGWIDSEFEISSRMKDLFTGRSEKDSDSKLV
jgi:hypothetical protein